MPFSCFLRSAFEAVRGIKKSMAVASKATSHAQTRFTALMPFVPATTFGASYAPHSVRRSDHVTDKWGIVARKRTPTGYFSQYPGHNNSVFMFTCFSPAPLICRLNVRIFCILAVSYRFAVRLAVCHALIYVHTSLREHRNCACTHILGTPSVLSPCNR